MAETIAIIDYGSGNLRSAAKAFERAGLESGKEVSIAVTSDVATVGAADRIVLPGVGAFGDCMSGLSALPGMVQALEDAVLVQAKPFFGICVGMQLMFEAGLEHGTHMGLGWLKGEVRALTPSDPTLKIPHMGWSPLKLTLSGKRHPVLSDWDENDFVYFVHSYSAVVRDEEACLATAEYGGSLTALVGKDNFIGAQFHPEKSQKAGLSLIASFLRWRP